MHQVEQYQSVTISSAQHSVCMCVSKNIDNDYYNMHKIYATMGGDYLQISGSGWTFRNLFCISSVYRKNTKNARIFTRISTKTMI